ncbi:MAG: BRCT domain-containing protein [Verrucomicrobiales bacterium]|nr:BRCT domain-containing protein [Verrucomicrobiales bacterium]
MSIDHPNHDNYRHFTKRQTVDKAVHTLTGMLRGVAIDDELNAAEVAEVLNWCNQYREIANRAPFDELVPRLDQMLKDGILDSDELDELLWLCKNISPGSEYYDEITNEIQSLQGMLHGVMADGHVSLEEATQIQRWINNNDYLKGTYPYDELDSLLLTVLADGEIDSEEQVLLRDFFEDFIEYSFAKKVRAESERVKAGALKEKTLPAICSNCPEIDFDARKFTFTGTSAKGTKKEIEKQVIDLGGRVLPNLTNETEFLVIGSAGNPCWAFSRYGRKVEKAANMRKQGHNIVIVHESDFWDAVEDNK